MSTDNVPNLVEFVSTVPPVVTSALVHLGPLIAHARHAAQVISWRAPILSESWLTLAAWWAICLFSGVLVRYFLPVAIVLGVVLYRWRATPTRQTAALVTETTLQNSISDLITLQTLTPSPPPIPLPSLKVAMNVIARAYIPYLLITFFIPTRVLLAISGSLVLCWRSTWLVFLRQTLWKSAWVRWAVYRTWAFLSQTQMLPTTAVAPHVEEAKTPAEEEPIIFLFTVFENQRWWMGIDWTAALLPSERPSWSSEALQPTSPPGPTFALPAPSEVLLPSVDSPGKRIRRTAVWKWAEPEWTVIVRTSVENQAARIARPLPEGTGSDTNPTLLSKAASRIREASEKDKESQKDREAENKGGSSAVHQDDENENQTIVLTDQDGWVYGDNKWEAPSNKGGMGKYTRYRRWTRIAVVTETVEVLEEDGPVGVKYDEADVPPSPVSWTSDSRAPSFDSERRNSSPLRQRLKSALSRTTVG